MTPQELIADALVPATRSVLVLGTFESRVTLYAQQVRALNLVDAIIAESLVRNNKDSRVAIIGGGAAGITAAVALAKVAPELGALDLYEQRPNILELQRNSTRYLHPHFYDWPGKGSEVTDAGLPVMNWQAGPAGDVAETLRAQFDATIRSSILKFHPDQHVSELIPGSLGSVRVVVPGGTAIRKVYDVVILAIGFGLEAYLEGDTLSYWTPSPLSAPIHTHLPNPVLFISGNGDGGLVDFMMAALNGLEHRTICEWLMKLDLGPAFAVLQAIEQEAWVDRADVDLLAQYRARLPLLIPTHTWAEIKQRLRPNVRITLHTNESRLLKRTTAVHNRLGTFLILEADADTSQAISVIVGSEFEAGHVPVRNEVRLSGHPPLTPFHRFLRLGPDKKTNLGPFATLLAKYPGATKMPASAIRPASPNLSASARARFAPYTTVPVVIAPAPPKAAVPDDTSVSVILTPAAPDQLAWSGDLPFQGAEQLWASNRVLKVYTQMSAASATDVMPAVARLGAHASAFILYAKDLNGWRAGLNALCAKRELPDPDIAVRCSVEPWVDPPAKRAEAPVPTATLRETIQSRLDTEVLRQLQEALYEILGPPAIETAWPIHPLLRQKLWATWQQWHTTLSSDPTVCRRFLRLLANADDRVHPLDSDLIRVGPKIIKPFLTKPILFGLAFATCSGHALVPTHQYPGNMVHNAVTGHACGVSWLKGRQLGSRCVAEQAWQAGVVLLSQLREAFQVIEGDTRFDRDIADTPAVGTISPAEEPLIIGADDVFLGALEGGEQPVRDYLQALFRRRSEVSRRTLEEA
jgi:hypothetical protein